MDRLTKVWNWIKDECHYLAYTLSGQMQRDVEEALREEDSRAYRSVQFVEEPTVEELEVTLFDPEIEKEKAGEFDFLGDEKGFVGKESEFPQVGTGNGGILPNRPGASSGVASNERIGVESKHLEIDL